MKTRLAKKLWCRQFHKVPPYWTFRLCYFLKGHKRDHRVIQAHRLTERKRRHKQ